LQARHRSEEGFILGRGRRGESYRDNPDNKIRLKSTYLQQMHVVKVSTRYNYGGFSCTSRGLLACLDTSLKCLCTNAHSIGNKQEELEICVWLQGFDLIAITEICWDSSHDWNIVMDGYTFFKKDSPGRLSGGSWWICSLCKTATGMYGASTSGWMMNKSRAYG